MKSFRQYITESDPGPGLDLPDGMSPSIQNLASMMSTAKGYITGIQTDSMPMYMYRSTYSPYQSALDPGKQTDDGKVQGGGGFKILRVK